MKVLAELWDEQDYIITIDGKPVGATLSKPSAHAVAEWLNYNLPWLCSHEAEQQGDPQNPVENAVDARRYRWLREQESLYVDGRVKEWSGGYFPDDFDKFVDAAMSSQSAPKGKE